MIWNTTNYKGEPVTWYSEDNMQIDIEKYKTYQNTLKQIKQAKPENYMTFKSMVEDMQKKAKHALEG